MAHAIAVEREGARVVVTRTGRYWPPAVFPLTLAAIWAVVPLGLVVGTEPALLTMVPIALFAMGAGIIESYRRGRMGGVPRVLRRLVLSPAVREAGYRDRPSVRIEIDGRVHLTATEVQRVILTRIRRTYPDSEVAGGETIVLWGLYLVTRETTVEVAHEQTDEESVQVAAEALVAALPGERVSVERVDPDPVDYEALATVPAILGGTLVAVVGPMVPIALVQGPVALVLTATLLSGGLAGFCALSVRLVRTARTRAVARLRSSAA